MHKRPPYFILLGWLWLAGLFVFMAMIAWDMGLLAYVLDKDQTHISMVLLWLTGLTSLHCAYRSHTLSQLEVSFLNWGKHNHHHNPLSTYLPLMLRSKENNLSLNAELLSEHLHYQHSFGWFIAGAMIKLGLLGTVIGFIMMLNLYPQHLFDFRYVFEIFAFGYLQFIRTQQCSQIM